MRGWSEPISAPLVSFLIAVRFLFDGLGSGNPINNSLNLLLCFFLVFHWLHEVLSGQNVPYKNFNLLTLLFVLSTGFFFAIAHSNPIQLTLIAFIKTLILIMFIKFLQNLDFSQIRKLQVRIIWIVAISGVIGGLELLLQKSIFLGAAGSTKLSELGRYSGLFSWQNIATICYSISLLWLINEYSRIKKSQRYFFVISNIIGLISSASLSGLLGLSVSLLYFLAKNKKNRRHSIFPIIIFTVFVGTTSSVLVSRIKEALSTDFSSSNLYVSNNSLEWRLIQWRFIISKIRAEWLFGYGLGSSTGVADFNGYLSHNSYLTIILEFGILGFIMIIACIYFSLRNFLKNFPKDYSVYVKSIYICVAVSGLAENLPNQVTLYIFIPLIIYNSRIISILSNQGVTSK